MGLREEANGHIRELSELSDDVWRSIFEGNAILFLGAGFSRGTFSITGEVLGSANDLTKKLGRLVGLQDEESEKYDLKIIGTHVIRKHQEEMLDVLRQTFTVHEVRQVQRDFVKWPWQRIYMTNYDNVVETAAAEEGKVFQTVVFSDEMPQKKENLCIHINGSVTHLTASTLQSEFKLIAGSYRNEEIYRSPWYPFMVDDFRVARKIIVVGYSMNSDSMIETLFGTPAMRKKLLFIQRKGMNPIEASLFTDYGDVVACGMDGFSQFLKEREKTCPPLVSPRRRKDFACFQYSHRMVSQVPPLAFQDFVHFYFYGALSQGFFRKKTTGEYEALVSRHPAYTVLREWKKRRIFLVTASLGNGKTVFCEMMRHELMETDAHVFLFKAERDGVEDEIRDICEKYADEPCVVIMDDVYQDLDVLRIFHLYDTRHITFLLTTRTSLASRACAGICSALGENQNQIRMVSLQALSPDECYEMAEILQRENLLSAGSQMARWATEELADHFERKCHSSIGQILLEAFDESVVKEHMEALIRKGTKKNLEFQDLMIGLLASSVWGLELDSTMIFLLLEYDCAQIFGTEEQEIFSELFIGQNVDAYRPVSSIFASAVLFKVFAPDEIMHVMERIARALHDFGGGKDVCRSAKKAILSHGNYKQMASSAEGRSAINHFYDSLRALAWYRENPFYWEEFALSYMDQKEYEVAEVCLETAENKAKNIPGFQPFQIMTVKADCRLSRLLDDAAYAAGNAPIDIIQQAEEFLLRYGEHLLNDKSYISAVSRKCVSVFRRFQESFGDNDRERYVSCMTILAKRLERWKHQGWDDRFMQDTLQEIADSIREANAVSSKKKTKGKRFHSK